MYIYDHLAKTIIGDYMSIWNKEEIKTKKEQLDKDIDVDILIIGAGMTGMTTAYFLKNKNVCVVDANIVGHGVTLNTTAKINYFQERIYTKIASMTSLDKAIKYLESQRYAIDIIKKIIEKENIDCDFKKVTSYVFANAKSEVRPLENEVRFLRSCGIKVKEQKLDDNIKSYKSYCVNDTYIFNPIKYLQSIYNLIKNEINIYENTKIIKIDKKENYYICYTANNKIVAKKVILACHYPYFIYPFLLPLKSSIEKSYMIISKVEEDKNYTCISSNKPTYSCRFYNDGKDIYKICLAESHNTSVKQDDLKHFNKVREIFNINEEDIIMEYSNVDIMTIDSLPYIGKLRNNLYIGCGYNTWGMTNSILAAKIISNMVLNKKNKYTKIFNPKRFNISNIVNFPYILGTSLKSFIGPKLFKDKPWYSDKIKFYKKDGKYLASYTDNNNKEHIIVNKCPHFGCSLIFNEKELTWDCPCHSSRFDVDGNCIKGPSNYDITYNK